MLYTAQMWGLPLPGKKQAAHTCHSSTWQYQLTPQCLRGQTEDKPVYSVNVVLTKSFRWCGGGGVDTGKGVKEFSAERWDLHVGITALRSPGAARSRSTVLPRLCRSEFPNGDPGRPSRARRPDPPSRSFWRVHRGFPAATPRPRSGRRKVEGRRGGVQVRIVAARGRARRQVPPYRQV